MFDSQPANDRQPGRIEFGCELLQPLSTHLAFASRAGLSSKSDRETQVRRLHQVVALAPFHEPISVRQARGVELWIVQDSLQKSIVHHGPFNQRLKALFAIGIEYRDVSNLAWAYNREVPRSSFEWGHSADIAPPLPWLDRQTVLDRDAELRQMREKQSGVIKAS